MVNLDYENFCPSSTAVLHRTSTESASLQIQHSLAVLHLWRALFSWSLSPSLSVSLAHEYATLTPLPDRTNQQRQHRKLEAPHMYRCRRSHEKPNNGYLKRKWRSLLHAGGSTEHVASGDSDAICS